MLDTSLEKVLLVFSQEAIAFEGSITTASHSIPVLKSTARTSETEAVFKLAVSCLKSPVIKLDVVSTPALKLSTSED